MQLNTEANNPSNMQRVSLSHRGDATLAVRTYGEGTLPCLLIHGFGEGAYVWNEIIPRLDAMRLITVDLLGHGDSSWSDNGEYDTQGFVSDVLVLLQALEIDKCVLVGHSLGGNIAARIAAARPECVNALVLVDTRPEPDAAAKSHVVASFLDAHRAYPSIEEYTRRLASERPLYSAQWLLNAAHQATRRSGDGYLVPKADRRLGHAFTSDDDSRGCLESLKAVRCPSMIVRGGYSAVLGAAQARSVASVMRSCVVATIPQAGHAVMADNPDAFVHAIKPFLQRFVTKPVTNELWAARGI